MNGRPPACCVAEMSTKTNGLFMAVVPVVVAVVCAVAGAHIHGECLAERWFNFAVLSLVFLSVFFSISVSIFVSISVSISVVSAERVKTLSS